MGIIFTELCASIIFMTSNCRNASLDNLWIQNNMPLKTNSLHLRLIMKTIICSYLGEGHCQTNLLFINRVLILN